MSISRSIIMLLVLAAMVSLVACGSSDTVPETAKVVQQDEQVVPSLPCPCQEAEKVEKLEKVEVPTIPSIPSDAIEPEETAEQKTDASQKKAKRFKVITIAVPIDDEADNIELVGQTEDKPAKKSEPVVEKEPEVDETGADKQEAEKQEAKKEESKVEDKSTEKQATAPSSKTFEKKVKVSSKVKYTSKDGNQKENKEAKVDKKRSKRDTKGSKKSSKGNKKSSKGGNKSEKKSKSRK